MVVNEGESDLLLNFACSCQVRVFLIYLTYPNPNPWRARARKRYLRYPISSITNLSTSSTLPILPALTPNCFSAARRINNPNPNPNHHRINKRYNVSLSNVLVFCGSAASVPLVRTLTLTLILFPPLFLWCVP